MTLRLVDAVAGYAHAVSPPATLAVARGEVVGLAGPNGIGKSTLLKAVLGEARLFSGRIEQAPGTRISYLPQQPVRLHEVPLSGAEVLAALGVAGLAPPPGLANRLGVRIDRLSGGEYQLLMLWATWVDAVELILLDEPTNNLDGRHLELAAEGLAAARASRAMLIVSHDRRFLEAVCTRIVDLGPRHG
ncbi:MAG TPA: ATP-binding cassette domain-containing protein [Rubrivivax sp.]|nr:ATP-binding cassette domain-containing protein [Rubrivivax sp.]